MSEATQPISRRNVAKGIAWTTPLIIGATAAPAYASSGGPPKITISGACTASNGALYTFTFNGDQTAPTVTSLTKVTANNAVVGQASVRAAVAEVLAVTRSICVTSVGRRWVLDCECVPFVQ